MRFEELHVTHLQCDGVDFSVGAEAANAITVSLSVESASATGVGASALPFYLADDASGLTPTAAVPDGGVAAGANGKVIETLADAAGMLVTDADGNVDVTLTETTAKTWYLVVVLPGGKLAVSPAIAFA